MRISFNTFKFIWIPRILMILFIGLFILFSLDAFGGSEPIINKLMAFFIHLMPSFLLLLFLVISWERPKLAGILFVILGIVFTFYYDTYEDPISFLTVSLIPILAGVLFFIPFILRRRREI